MHKRRFCNILNNFDEIESNSLLCNQQQHLETVEMSLVAIMFELFSQIQIKNKKGWWDAIFWMTNKDFARD